MTDIVQNLRDAIANLGPDPWLSHEHAETPDQVFAAGDDRHQRHNAEWWRRFRADRESKEDSP